MKLVPRFFPSVNAFKFSNGNWAARPVMILKTPLGDIPLGNAANGLCGGMVFSV